MPEILASAAPRQDRAIWRVCLAVGLTAGLVDVGAALLATPSRIWSPGLSVAEPLLATAALFVLAQFLLGRLARAYARGLSRTDPEALEYGIGAGLLTVFVLALLGDAAYLPRGARVAVRLGVATCVAALMTAGVASLARELRSSAAGARRLDAGLLLPPLACGQAVLLARFWPWPWRGAAMALGVLLAAWAAFRLASPRSTLVALGGVAGLAVAAAASGWGAARESPVPPGPGGKRSVRHVVLLTIDTLRADRPLPGLDRLARDGVVFEQAVSPSSWTLPAISSLMTGLSPAVHQAEGLESRLPPGLPTLAERLREAGYRTAAFGENWFLTPFVQPRLAQGFERYDFFPRRILGRAFGARVLRKLSPGRFGATSSAEQLTARAAAWMEEHRREDFFLWVHYFDPHVPYEAHGQVPPGRPRRFDDASKLRSGARVASQDERAWIRALYDQEVAYVDRAAARLLEHLSSLGLYEDALVVFTSDHGEELWEHGGFEHGHTLYEEVLSVPLVLKLPGSTTRARIATRVSTERIMPTLLELCALPAVPGAAASLVPVWQSGAPEEPVLSTGVLHSEPRIALSFGGMKYVRLLISGLEELYDLEWDPREQASLALTRPDELRTARLLLEERLRAARALQERLGVTPVQSPGMAEEAMQHLRSLGYVH